MSIEIPSTVTVNINAAECLSIITDHLARTGIQATFVGFVSPHDETTPVITATIQVRPVAPKPLQRSTVEELLRPLSGRRNTP